MRLQRAEPPNCMSFQQLLSSFANCMISLPSCRIANARSWSAVTAAIFWPGVNSTTQSPCPRVEFRNAWSYDACCFAFRFWNFASLSMATPLIVIGPAWATVMLQLVPSTDVDPSASLTLSSPVASLPTLQPRNWTSRGAGALEPLGESLERDEPAGLAVEEHLALRGAVRDDDQPPDVPARLQQVLQRRPARHHDRGRLAARGGLREVSDVLALAEHDHEVGGRRRLGLAGRRTGALRLKAEQRGGGRAPVAGRRRDRIARSEIVRPRRLGGVARRAAARERSLRIAVQRAFAVEHRARLATDDRVGHEPVGLLEEPHRRFGRRSEGAVDGEPGTDRVEQCLDLLDHRPARAAAQERDGCLLARRRLALDECHDGPVARALLKRQPASRGPGRRSVRRRLAGSAVLGRHGSEPRRSSCSYTSFSAAREDVLAASR